MKKIIDYIIEETSKKDLNDPIRSVLYEMLDIVLQYNIKETQNYILDISDKDTFWAISNHFGSISGKVQKLDFVQVITKKTESFRGTVDEKYMKRFEENVREAIEALDEEIRKQNDSLNL